LHTRCSFAVKIAENGGRKSSVLSIRFKNFSDLHILTDEKKRMPLITFRFLKALELPANNLM